jgi:hypothetical protein
MPAPSEAGDLTKIERTISKAPKLETRNPRYALLVFGTQAKTAWLVVDGRKVYLDRNGNGDLTEPGETLTATVDPDTKQQPEEQGFREFRGTVEIPAADAGPADPDGKPARYDLELSMLNEAASYFTIKSGGREQVAYPQLGSKPEDAPVMHVGGPLEVLVLDRELVRGKKGTDLRVQIGTPGIGKDAAAAVANEGLDAAIRPEIEAEFPAKAGGSPIRVKLSLNDRCCGSMFHGRVPVPEEAGAGRARLLVSFPAWKPGPSAKQGPLAGKNGPPAKTFEIPLAPLPELK